MEDKPLPAPPVISRPLQGKLGIVTGASRGIGAAVAANLAAKGCNLVLNYSSAGSIERTQKLADLLSAQHNVKIATAQVDLGAEDAGKTLVAATLAAFPGMTISVIVNNAAVANNAKLPDVTLDDFGRQYAVNVRGPLLLMQAAQPHLPNDRSGRIVNVSSVSASFSYASQSVYAGTKAALESMTRTWARELAEQATVNAVNPGPVETDMYATVNDEFVAWNRGWLVNTPLSQVSVERDGEDAYKRFAPVGGRPAQAEEIAGVIGMLCGAEGGWCTGSVVCANGGMKMTF